MKELKTISFSLISLGLLLFLIGELFKIMHWPDLFKGIYSGPAVLMIGLILLVVSISKTNKQSN